MCAGGFNRVQLETRTEYGHVVAVPLDWAFQPGKWEEEETRWWGYSYQKEKIDIIDSLWTDDLNLIVTAVPFWKVG